MRTDRIARLVVAVATAGFLVAGDIVFPPQALWPVLRLFLLVAALSGAAWLAARRRDALVALRRLPLVWFMVFASLGLAAALASAHPRSAFRYAAGYVAVAVLAAVVATEFPRPLLLRGLLATLLVKVCASLAVAGLPEAWRFGERFQGLLGNPNPMGAVAGLTFLLAMVNGWY